MNNDIFADMDRAIETGQPVTRSFNIGGKRCQGSTDEIIDIELISSSVSEPNPGSHWDSRSSAASHRFEVVPTAPASKSCFPSPSYMPSSVDKPRMAPEVTRLLRGVDKARLPSDLASDSNRRIFFALIEYEFSMLIDELRIQLFKKLGCDYTQAYRYVGQWKYARKTMSESVIKIAVEILDKGKCISASILGHLLGLKPEYCFRSFPCKDEASSGISIRCKQIQERIPNQLVIKGRLYLLKSIDYQNDYRGMKEQAVCLYMDKACLENKFFLIANRVEKDGSYVLEIGTTPVPARLYSRSEMAIHESATIIICMNMTVAMEFRRIARESSLLERERIIISGYFGDSSAFETLNLNDTAEHHVVLVPEFNQESLVSASRLADRCEKAGATSVRIYRYPIIASGALDCFDTSGQNQWYDVLMEKAIRIEDVELPSKFARKVCERSSSRSEYAEWLISAGLVTFANTQVDNDLDDGDDIQFISLGDIPDEDTEISEPVTLESIFNNEDCTFMWAPTDVGKSWASLEFGLGLATGTEAFGIPARCPHVVAIMDGEISTRKKRKHVRQLLQNRPELISIADKNLRIMPPSGKMRRFNEEYADKLIPKLKKHNIEVLILDNLQALDPKAGKFNAEDLFAFVRRMKLEGIAIFIIHHADKEGKNYKGPTDLVDLSQTVFRGEGAGDVRKLVLDDPESTHVLDACDEGGPVLRLTVTKGKVGGMKGKSVIYHLPIGGVWTHLEDDLVPIIDPDSLPASVSAEFEGNSAIPFLGLSPEMHSLTPDEEKVYASLKRKKYTRSQLEAVTGFKADKLGKILRRLVKLNLVKRYGVGKATYYQCL
jgi:hypothetical protein